MMLNILLALLLAPGASIASAASTSDFECFKESAENEVCVVLPDDAVQTVRLPKAQKTLSPAPRQVEMVSKYELSGNVLQLDNEFEFAEPTDAAGPLAPTQFANAMKSQDSLRWIETFLKTGPASQSDDIFVRPASKTKN